MPVLRHAVVIFKQLAFRDTGELPHLSKLLSESRIEPTRASPLSKYQRGASKNLEEISKSSETVPLL